MDNASPMSFADLIRAVAIGRRPAWTLLRIAVLVVTAFLLFKYVFLLRRIESTSMIPTLREGSVRLINRFAYRFGPVPQRGDIVAIRTSGETVMYIKRIVGLPGETIAIRDGQVFIDGEKLEEPYVQLPRRAWKRAPLKIDPGDYYLIGDNRSMSQEQHEFGRADARRIIGKVVW